jgi:hypothetical protein
MVKKPDARSSAVLLVATLCGMGAPASSIAQDDGLRRCRAIPEAAARLACYDALVPSAAPAARTGAPAVPAVPTQPPALPREASASERFGLEHKAASSERADRIESYIPGTFKGWGPNSEITLANGQVWKVVDGSTMAYVWQDPKVYVRRGMLGSFFLDIEGENRSARVRRIK